MARLLSWIYNGILFMVVMTTLASNTNGGKYLEDKDSLSTRKGGDTENLSECLLKCTVETYNRMFQRQDKQTVRFKEIDSGKQGEYCWSTSLNSNAGESLLQAYIVLPVHTPVSHGHSLELETSSVSIKSKLRPHWGPTLLVDECGLRFNVMGHFSRSERDPTVCVKLDPQSPVRGERLLCPPFLVTIWENQGHTPVIQDEG